MLHKIIEIRQEHQYLFLTRGFLHIGRKDDKESRHQVVLDDIESLVISAQSTTLTKKVLIALAERGTCTILCNEHYQPVATVMPPGGVAHSGSVIRAQAEATKLFNRHLWRLIIQEKITHQAFVLAQTTVNNNDINKLKQYSLQVLPGDSSNREGTAAQLYWRSLFGPSFRRNRAEPGINSYLNYGYALLRATVARAVCAAGLSPALGIFHKNETNAMTLVDDLMEPYRPLVDRLVWQLQLKEPLETLTPEHKKLMSQVLFNPVSITRGKALLVNAVYAFTTSLAQSYRQKKITLFMIPKLTLEQMKEEEESLW